MLKNKHLTAEDNELIQAHLWVAEVVATRFRGRHSREELLGSAYMGLVKAALKRPRPKCFRAFARLACKNQILNDLALWHPGHLGSARWQRLDAYDCVGASDDPVRSAIDLEDEERLEEAIATLKPIDARIIRLRRQGLEVKAIASLVGWSRENTSVHLSAATRALAAELAGR